MNSSWIFSHDRNPENEKMISSFIYSFIHSFIHSLIHSFIHSLSHSFIHSFSQSVSQSVNQSISQSGHQSISQSVNQSISQSINQSINQAINQPTNQPSKQSIKQSINQSINHPSMHACIHSFIHSLTRSFVPSFVRSFVRSFLHPSSVCLRALRFKTFHQVYFHQVAKNSPVLTSIFHINLGKSLEKFLNLEFSGCFGGEGHVPPYLTPPLKLGGGFFSGDTPSGWTGPHGGILGGHFGMGCAFQASGSRPRRHANVSATWVFPKIRVPPFHTPKWSFLVGKPMVVGYHHFWKHPHRFQQTHSIQIDGRKFRFMRDLTKIHPLLKN